MAHILGQVCGSLEEAHAQGIVHRDLKPDNIFLTERAGQQDFVKVLDFGIAKRSGEEDKDEAKLTQQGMVLGTPPYMSPEQFTGRPIDVRSDIYSLGVMAYEMLTGQAPLRGRHRLGVGHAAHDLAALPVRDPPQGRRAPEKMRQAVMRALAKPVEQRFQTVREFMEGLSIGGAPMSSYLGSPVPSPAPGPPGTELLPGAPRISVISNPGDPVSGRAVTQGDLGAMSAPGFGPPMPQTMPSPGGASSGPVYGPGQTAMAPSGPGFVPAGGPPHVPTGGNVAYPAPPPAKGGGGKVVAIVLVGLLVAGGAAAGIYFATKKHAGPVASTTVSNRTRRRGTTPGSRRLRARTRGRTWGLRRPMKPRSSTKTRAASPPSPTPGRPSPKSRTPGTRACRHTRRAILCIRPRRRRPRRMSETASARKPRTSRPRG